MKLTEEDKELLTKWGFSEDDFNQIEKATNKTEYELNGNKIPLTEVLQILDRETYLSGISRSAFHWTCSRKGKNGETINFDSSKLFR